MSESNTFEATPVDPISSSSITAYVSLALAVLFMVTGGYAMGREKKRAGKDTYQTGVALAIIGLVIFVSGVCVVYNFD